MNKNKNYEMNLPELTTLGWGATIEDLKMKVNVEQSEKRTLRYQMDKKQENINKWISEIEKLETKKNV